MAAALPHAWHACCDEQQLRLWCISKILPAAARPPTRGWHPAAHARAFQQLHVIDRCVPASSPALQLRRADLELARELLLLLLRLDPLLGLDSGGRPEPLPPPAPPELVRLPAALEGVLLVAWDPVAPLVRCAGPSAAVRR